MRALVSGASGQVGSALSDHLEAEDWEVYRTDIDSMDVRSRTQVGETVRTFLPDVLFHLAGEKLAVEGEISPESFAETNISGTANVVSAVKHMQLQGGRGKVVFASTCKAADPETAYGASKLIAERIVLNAGGVVVRFFNIPEAGPSVFTVWEDIPSSEPIPFTDCWRYFVPLAQAVKFMARAARFPWGRYAPHPGSPRFMGDVARKTYPGRRVIEIPRRRGDRAVEPLHAACEKAEWYDDCWRIVGAHDPQMSRLRVAA